MGRFWLLWIFVATTALAQSLGSYGRYPYNTSSSGTPGPPGPAGPTGPSGPPFVGVTEPASITATGGVPAPSASVNRTLLFITGSPGAVTVTAIPAIAPGAFLGQELVLLGGSDTDTVTIEDGAGISLNGSIEIGADGPGSAIWLVWNGTLWNEITRR